MNSLHLDRDWLYQKYVVEALSTYDIAAIVHRDPKRIYDKLRDFEIPTRPRGLNLKGADNYMAMPGAVPPMRGRRHTKKSKKKISIAASQPKPHLRGRRNGMYGRTGESNPNFKDGLSPERQRVYSSSRWKRILRAIRKRDGRKCKRCGCEKQGPKAVHTHHIQSWDSAPKLRFKVSNIVTLCNTCHSWVHSRLNVHREFLTTSE